MQYDVKLGPSGFEIRDEDGQPVALRHSSTKAQAVADALNAGEQVSADETYGLEYGPGAA